MNTFLKKITLFAFSIMFAFGGTFAPLNFAFADAPSEPVNVSPADGTTETVDTFFFEWSDATGGVAPYTYNWQASTSPDNTAGILDSTIASHTGLSDSSVESPGTPDATYYWQAQAVDANNEVSSWSTIWSVTVDTTPEPVDEAEITHLDAYYSTGTGYTAIGVDFTTENFTNATDVELRVNRTDSSTYSITAQQSVIDAINATSPKTTSGPIVITGSRTSGSWNNQTGTWSGSALPESVDVIITLDDDTTVTLRDTTISENLALQSEVLPAPAPTLDSFPSTNDQNRTSDKPHVNLVSSNIGSVTLDFINNTVSQAFFEVRIDGVVQTTGTDHYNPCKLSADPLNGGCNGKRYLADDEKFYTGGISVNNKTDASPRLTYRQETINADSTVEIRLALGGERDWDFDWVSFDALSDDRPRTDIEVTGDTATAENEPGWLFNRDILTMSPFEFTNDQNSIGDGSLFVKPITNTLGAPGAKDKFIGELFEKTEINRLNSFSYDVMMAAGDEDKINVSVYANIDNSNKYYDCRYDYVPSGANTSSFTTVTFDKNDTPVNVAKSSTSRVTGACPATLAEMPTGSFVRVFAINVGDTSASDTGLSAYLDKVVLDTADSVITYDFEKAFVDTTKPTGIATYAGGTMVGDVMHVASIEDLSFTETISDDIGVVRATYLVQKLNTTTNAYEGFCGNWNAGGSGSHNLGGTTSETYTENNVENCKAGGTAVWTDGTYKIFHAAYDAAGNEGKYNTNRQVFVIDSNLPLYPYGEITSPAVDFNVVSGETTLLAMYDDNTPSDTDTIQWAVRIGSCSGAANNIYGNVNGMTNVATWDNENFSFTFNADELEAGEYCFVFNPSDDAGENDVRETRWFTVNETVEDGGGTDTNVPALDGNPSARSSSRRAGFSTTGTTGTTGGQVLGAESYNFTLLLKRGSTGTEVMELQKFLNAAGYNSGVEDGIFGPITEAAVKAFQMANGLVADGIVGPLTRAVLNA